MRVAWFTCVLLAKKSDLSGSSASTTEQKANKSSICTITLRNYL